MRRSMDKASVKTGDVLQSDTTSYQLTGFNGEGTFGRVANCVDLNTGEVVAVKIFKTNDNDVIQSEMAMLEKVRALDPDQNNIVKFIENFTFHKLPCVVFEMLDRSLWNLMEEREWTELSLNEIRPVTQQLLVACEALKNIGIIYMDMKPDNIMFVNHKDQPFKIKLIDFGLALPVSQGEVGEGIQTFAYGAPEVILGLPFSEAVDMWGVGCIMAFMYFGMHLFPLDCPYDWMKTLVHLLGPSNHDQMAVGKYGWMYFIFDEDEGWRLRTSEEYKEVTGHRTKVSESFFYSAKNLEDAVKRYPKKQDNLEYEDRIAFLDLLKCCLNTNAEQRICPREALYHRFMKMAHLVDGIETNSYTDMAHKFMNVSSMYYLDESEDVSYLENSCAEDFKIRGVVDSETKNFKPRQLCLNSDKDSAPSGFTRKSASSYTLPERSRDKHLYTDIPSPCNLPGPSAAIYKDDIDEGIVEYNHKPSTSYHSFPVKLPNVLQSDTTSYQITGFEGEGTFGKVAKCVDLNTGEVVAVKIRRTNDDEIIQSEVAMLETVRALDPDQNNIVKFIENLQFHKLSCLVFEMLDRSLWNLMEEREWTELSLNEIRPVTQQLLVACEALKNIGIIHMNLEPENIMFVNHKDQPFKIKLINFGLALPVSQGQVGEGTQPIAYVAPEVILGFPFSEAVDMWGVGCIMAFMYFGMHLFPLDCPYDWMKTLLQLLGPPNYDQMTSGKYGWMYFIFDEDAEWRLRTSEEYEEVTGHRSKVSESFFHSARNLEDAVKRYLENQDDLEYEDRMAFSHLLKCCLNTNAEQRICPREALYHRFTTMAHLVDEMETNSYTDMALKFMNVSSMYYLDKSNIFSYLEHSLAEDAKIESDIDSDTKNSNPRQLSLNSDNDSAPSGFTRKSASSYSFPERSRDKHSFPYIPSPDNSPGPSAATYKDTIDKGDLDYDHRPSTSYHTFLVKVRNVLQSNTTSYQIIGFNGKGTFGKVAKCFDLNTGEVVAVKIRKTNDNEIIQREVAMLERVRALDPDRNNIVKFIENFQFHKLSCLVFEMLDRSLWNLMEEREWTELSLNEIRPVTQQLLVACEALNNIGIIYMDMKPDNIMFVNHKDQPFKIKLIDFGLALPVSQGEVGEAIENLAYVAPEVVLGLPLSEAVDMWGVGCIMAFMYFGIHLFPLDCPYDWMKTLVHLLGPPNYDQMTAGKYGWRYFIFDENTEWRLRTPEEYEAVTDQRSKVSESFLNWARNLKDAVKRYPKKQDDLEYEDRMAFLGLLKRCLHPNAERRICPRKALYHRFTIMAHLVDKMETNYYTDMALKLMNVSSRYYIDRSKYFVEHSHAKDAKIESELDSNITNSNPRQLCKYSGLTSLARESTTSSIFSNNGVKAAIRSYAEEVRTSPDEVPQKKPFRSIRKFFSRIKKLFFSCFKRQKN
ncbi:putative homeodomain-interacting protein kinase 2-like [Scophthalmus maximus]|uniref:Putative homeodomain-interacting protein kinase 2-like n=1 Tax=Scophthalmus maximus TaxID=52904 RepID=A0A2U9CN46_SCOMX|nr:putative homeodomain-interacting protein kinase 2-like [Scophthalmus maximus]KAF0025732.1 hypothetical protein F2P81_022613 [Scophthalmus maximus]